MVLLFCDQIMYLCRENESEKLSISELSKSIWKVCHAEILYNIRTYIAIIASAVSICYKSNKNVIIFLTSTHVLQIQWPYILEETVGFDFISKGALKNYWILWRWV